MWLTMFLASLFYCLVRCTTYDPPSGFNMGTDDGVPWWVDTIVVIILIVTFIHGVF